MTENHFDTAVAATYDADSGHDLPTDIDPVVDVLARLAGAEPVLEFAIGTGRIALPLSRRGVRVHGIELSAAMLEKLRQKPGGREIPCTIGDMARDHVEGQFSLVYLVFNTIMNLTTQSAQVDCFRNAAGHLATGGHFVVEVMTPKLQRLAAGERFVAWEIDPEHWGVDEYDPVGQRLVSHHLHRRPEGLERRSVPFRYVWPEELDLMARLAGMSRVERWADWHGSAFGADSPAHVSVWRKD